MPHITIQELKAKIAKLTTHPPKTVLLDPEQISDLLNLNIAIVYYFIVTGELAASWDQVTHQWLIEETVAKNFQL